MKNKIILIGFCMVAGVLLVSILYWISGAPNTHKNGFNRRINPDYITSWHSLNIGLTNYVIVGSTRYQSYMQNIDDPLVLKTVDFDLTHLTTEP